MSAVTVQHNSESLDSRIEVFAFDFGEIKLMKRALSRFYYCYSAQGGFIYLRHTGTSNYDELIDYNTEIANDKSWTDGAKVFTDVRWLNSRAFTYETHCQLSKDIALIYEKKARYAGDIVALCSNDFEFGMFRMFYSLLEEGGDQKFSTVLDLDAAVKFLEIDRALLDRVIAEINKIESALNSL